VLFVLSVGGLVQAQNRPELPEGVFANVAGELITQEQYHAFYAQRMRQRFYHGKIPEAELDAFEQEVRQQLIDRALLRQEALKRKLIVDEAGIKRVIDEWRLARGDVSDELVKIERQKRYDQALIDMLRNKVESEIPAPSEDALVVYYEANKNKFTRPEQLKLSLILLKVAPYAESSVWLAAYDKAQGLLSRLIAGDSFSVMAREYSEHESAAEGGDLGFVHAGMLSSEVQAIVNGLSPGEMVDKPIVLLQGMALLRLEQRRDPVLIDYEHAKPRVAALLLKERQLQAWNDLLAGLRDGSSVVLMRQ
jgi:hypothetical protein